MQGRIGISLLCFQGTHPPCSLLVDSALERKKPMTQAPAPKPIWTAAEIAELTNTHISQPFNPNSDIYVTPLSQSAGLERVAFALARVPPGKESFVYHSHEKDEEFLYILS